LAEDDNINVYEVTDLRWYSLLEIISFQREGFYDPSLFLSTFFIIIRTEKS